MLFAHPISPTAPSCIVPVEVSMNLLMCRSEKRHGSPLEPCFTLALNMQSSMLIAAAEVFLMSLNINCAHPLDIMDRSDHYLVHNDVWDNRPADLFNLKPANSDGRMVALAMGLNPWTGGGESKCSHRNQTSPQLFSQSSQKHILRQMQLLCKKWPVCKRSRQHLFILQQLLFMPSLLPLRCSSSRLSGLVKLWNVCLAWQTTRTTSSIHSIYLVHPSGKEPTDNTWKGPAKSGRRFVKSLGRLSRIQSG